MPSTDSGNSDKAYQLVKLLTLTKDGMRNEHRKELNHYNIHPRRVAILLTIQKYPDNSTPTAIAKRILRKRHTLSVQLSKMYKDGLITKVADPARKNGVVAKLTELGREKLEQVSKFEVIESIMSSLSKSEHREFSSLLTKIRGSALQYLNLNHLMPDVLADRKIFTQYLLLTEAVEIVRKAWQQELNKYNIGIHMADVLISIEALDKKATPIAIANRLLKKRHTISETLSKMENDGLLVKINDLDRKDFLRVELTEKGFELTHRIIKENILRTIINSISDKQQIQLELYLQRLLIAALLEIN